MNEMATYVRQKLSEARKEKGRIAQIVRALEIDRRTLNKISEESHTPHAATLDKLSKYFKKQARTNELRKK